MINKQKTAVSTVCTNLHSSPCSHVHHLLYLYIKNIIGYIYCIIIIIRVKNHYKSMTYILQFNLQNLQICLKSLINQWLASYSFCTVSFLIYTLLVFWWLSLLPPHLLRNNVHIKKQQPRLDMKNITVLAIVIAVAFISGVTSAVVVSKLNQKAEEITSKLEEIDSRRNAQYGIMKSCIANPKKCEGK